MSPHRCQLCGRRKGLTKAGGIVAHHVRGVPCGGAGHPPIEQSDAALVAAIEAQRALEARLRAIRRDHAERRVNWPLDPGVQRGEWAARALADRLERRLKWHRDTPARKARQLEKYGYTL